MPLPTQVIIEGFKSYKDQTISDPFSDKINVIGEAGPPASVLAAPAATHLLSSAPPVAPQSAPMAPASRTSSTVRAQGWQRAPMHVAPPPPPPPPPVRVPLWLPTAARSACRAAFLFVLDQMTATTHQEERQKLLHVSSGGGGRSGVCGRRLCWQCSSPIQQPAGGGLGAGRTSGGWLAVACAAHQDGALAEREGPSPTACTPPPLPSPPLFAPLTLPHPGPPCSTLLSPRAGGCWARCDVCLRGAGV